MSNIRTSCALENGLELFTGKWKICILSILFEKPYRFGEIKKKFPNISIKMLSQVLSELKTADLIKKKDFKTKPLKVMYSISLFGETLKPIINEIEIWEGRHLAQIHTSLVRYKDTKIIKKII